MKAPRNPPQTFAPMTETLGVRSCVMGGFVDLSISFCLATICNAECVCLTS